MRRQKDLEFIVEQTVLMSKGSCPFTIIAHDEEEAGAFKKLLKGRRGAKAITIKIEAEEF